MTRWYSEDEVASALTRVAQWRGEGQGLDSAVDEGLAWLRRERDTEATPPVDDGAVSRIDTAVAALVHEGPLQDRLRNVGAELLPLRPEDFRDSDARAMFAELVARLTAQDGPGDGGRLKATTAELSDGDAAELARDLLALHRHVLQVSFPHEDEL